MTKPSDGKKISRPTKILRRVLSKTSNSSTTQQPQKAAPMEGKAENDTVEDNKQEVFVKPTINVEAELLLLKEQIGTLQHAVASMQNETETKEVAIANLAREKERLTCDLRRQQRTNHTLKQQLEEEREFYYKEKELYCQEMNDCKKLKKSLKHGDQKSQLEYYKKEATKLKETLTQTLEANYNLSVKFLRMKNTKYCIKNRLKKLETIHEMAINDFHMQIEHLKSELNEIVERELQVPIPPSNKKYLQIVKQNGVLTHENLCLRLEADRLSLEVDRLKMLQIRNDTNNKLKYINHKKKTDAKLNDEKKNSCNAYRNSKDNQDHYRADGKEEQLIYFTNEDNFNQKTSRKDSELSIRKIFENEIKCGLAGGTMIPDGKNGIDSREETQTRKDTNYDLIQLNENPSETLTNDSEFIQCYEAVRTQSAPEIVRTSLFVNDT